MIRTIFALAAAGTMLALATPSASQAVTPRAATCAAGTICRVVIFKGGGDSSGIGPASLPSPGDIKTDTKPESLTVDVADGTVRLDFDVASLEGQYGTCADECSKWWYYSNGQVQVVRFRFKTATGYYLDVPFGNSNWREIAPGVYTPIYLHWSVTPASPTWYCIHLDTVTYDWSLVSTGPTDSCP